VLAEKPIAKDVATAKDLIQWTQNPSNTQARFSIAENFRFLESFAYAASQVSSLGRILTFRARVCSYVAPGGKYFETAWRKTPEYQGGFLLDGGVHFIAGTRLLLQGGGEAPAKLSAFTAQLQPHLPPVDTLHATVQLGSGASGTVTISFGTTDKGSEYVVAAEKGTVHVSRGKVVVSRAGEEDAVKEFADEGSGVKQEVRAWAEGLEKGEADAAQSPEEALKDLQVLEAALRSGEQGGQVVELEL
jgi:predicted dehydrogenase